MPATHDRSLALIASRNEPSEYVINLYTSLSDPDAAADLAVRVSEAVRGFEHLSHLSTTISVEDDVRAEPVRVYTDLVR
jgi:hypothetical protein